MKNEKTRKRWTWLTITIITLSLTAIASCSGGGDDVIPPPIELRLINAGTFTMGSPNTETDRQTNETQHSVTLSKGFYMGKYQVTQEQYQAIMGSNPSNFTSAVTGESGTPGKLPVEQVSWYDAIVFCNKLSVAEGLNPVYSISGKTDPAGWGAIPTSSDATWNAVVMDKSKNGYRLPTEAEWEYACRAGTTTAYNTGASITTNTGWYSANSDSKTHKVGLKPANAWGLYDMHGNVFEWCWDWYKEDITTDTTDPTGAVTGTYRVLRGGSWVIGGQDLRSALRVYGNPSGRDYDLGFRLVRS
jgi:formylglycine-generating enzyme required for sulfatase activity